MQSYPKAIVPVGHVEPVPRRIRAYVGGVPLLDTTGARYVWEMPPYPQYYVPLADVDRRLLVDEGRVERTPRGTARVHGIRAGDTVRPSAARVLGDDGPAALSGTVRFEWTALDAWFEEDEEVFVHPRSPYSRVDALRSTRRVRVELDGVPLAESAAPVLVFETGLPTRYYLDRTDVDLTRLVPSDTRTACPYKGRTTDYWSVRTDTAVHPDLAWSYGFPTGALGPVAGLIAFYNEHVDLVVDGRRLDRPRTAFS
ncbi:DUF427 domain-containing protein [Micromonospora sp. NBC_01655]|uniref:DUF427 domain-containing protein n=1 Tax=Micromonospora sp. NBC_01655 TaxID=2975983 RepID=UPI002251ED73|nr:DUF427 domain-containing protein [Micromonospora sp. NBC_01655]MCX4472579.1 DUF427 domain-containing protein [Micromonospora sp. NBC_01655]